MKKDVKTRQMHIFVNCANDTLALLCYFLRLIATNDCCSLSPFCSDSPFHVLAKRKRFSIDMLRECVSSVCQMCFFRFIVLSAFVFESLSK